MVVLSLKINYMIGLLIIMITLNIICNGSTAQKGPTIGIRPITLW